MAPPPTEISRPGLLPSPPLPANAPAHEMTTTAMERFSCLADRCEDTCCRDWAVPVNRVDLDRMTEVMTRTPAGRERLVRLVVIGNPARVADGLAHLQMDEAGACPMLEADSRCGVHAEFGEEALTTPCSIFPRTSLAVQGQLEVGGSLGCPEVARLTLLPSEPLRLLPASRPMLPRAYVGKTIPADPEDAYAHAFVRVRAALASCFDENGLSLGARFVLAADLAERVQEFFHRGTAEFQGARRAFAEHRLDAELAHTESRELRRALAGDLAGLKATGEAVTTFVKSMLEDRLRLPHSPRFAKLLADVLGTLEPKKAAANRPTASDDAVTAGSTWQAYARRRDDLETRMGQRLTALFSKYCQHFLLRQPYTDAPTLLDYLYNLGVHLAAVRFLTIGHPDLAARLAADPDPETDALALEDAVVHVVQTFTKAVSHHTEFLHAVGLGTGPTAAGVTFGRLVLLAKFF